MFGKKTRRLKARIGKFIKKVVMNCEITTQLFRVTIKNKMG
jgi:hypothetical protein